MLASDEMCVPGVGQVLVRCWPGVGQVLASDECVCQVLVSLENLMSSLPKIHRSLSEPILNRSVWGRAGVEPVGTLLSSVSL